MSWRRFIEFVDWTARAHFVGTMLWGGGGWAVTFFATSANGWDVSSVWISSLIAGACCAFIFIAFKLRRIETLDRPKIEGADRRRLVTRAAFDLEESSAFYNSWLYPAADNSSHVLQRVLHAIRKHPDGAVRSHEALIQRSIIDEERAAISRLSNALRGIDLSDADDIQDRIGGYYRSYQGVRTWIAKGIELTGIDLSHDSIFQEWKRVDGDFIRELRRLIGPPRYDRLRQVVQGIGWNENVTRDLFGSR
jgi:hypothetical protein